MVVARLCSASMARLQPALAGRGGGRGREVGADGGAGVLQGHPRRRRRHPHRPHQARGPGRLTSPFPSPIPISVSLCLMRRFSSGRIPTPQSSSPNLTNFFGKFPTKTLPMKTLWLAVYIADAVSFAVFYYEGDQDKSVGKRLRTVLMWVVASAVVCVLILGILYAAALGGTFRDDVRWLLKQWGPTADGIGPSAWRALLSDDRTGKMLKQNLVKMQR